MSDRFHRFNVTSPGNFDLYVPHEQRKRAIILQLTGTSSFNLRIEQTAFTTLTASGTSVGSQWIDTFLVYGDPMLTFLADLNATGVRFKVNSVVGNLGIAAAFTL